MLKGDLVSTPLPSVLRDLAEGAASGCLHVDDGVGDTAKVYLRGGQVYAVQVPGNRPQLGARLVSSGALGPEALSEALEAQRTELQGWRLSELLVHLGYVDEPVVEAFVHEQVREQTSDLLRWPTGTWKFRVNERTREDAGPPTPVEQLLQDVAERQRVWESITEVLHGPDAVPMLSAAGQSDTEMSIDPDAWSLLCKVDGTRSVSELARECGFTLFEAGRVVFSLVRSGLLEVEETEEIVEEPFFEESVTARLTAAFAPSIPQQAGEPTPEDMAALLSSALSPLGEDRTTEAFATQDEDAVEGSLGRVSAALAALIGTTTDESLFDSPKPRTKAPAPLTADEQARAAKKAEKAARDAKRRERDAEELATAQAELEAGRLASATVFDASHEAEIVSLADVRRDKDAEEALAAEAAEAAAEAERVSAETRAAEEARVAAEQAEAERLAAEAERLAVERAEAERLAAEQAEAERASAETRAAAEARAAAEQAEAERLAAERAEAERLAAEQAEAERVSAATRAAEETQRLAAEQAEAERAEAERLAAEQAEADRASAEARATERAEAERLAEEQQAEAERIAAQDRLRIENELREAAQEQAAAELLAQADRDAREAQEREAAARAAEDEQQRLTAQRAEASSAFAELAAAAASSSDVVVVAEVETPDETPVEQRQEFFEPYKAPDTDMASLFRELSSLGMEDAPEPPPSRPAPPPRAAPAAAAPAKKKKGLFGR